MKIAGYIEVPELDLNGENYCDGSKYPHPGLYWLPNARGGSYAFVHGYPPNFVVYSTMCSKEYFTLKETIALKINPFDPKSNPLLPGEVINRPEFPQELMHEVISVDTFLKALALAMNQNTNDQVIEEILK